MRFGRTKCFSHYISAKALEEIILTIYGQWRRKSCLTKRLSAKNLYGITQNLASKTVKSTKRALKTKQKRTDERSRLIQATYEDNVNGKMPEDICSGLIEKYSAEQKTLAVVIEELEETENTQQSADELYGI